MSEAIDASIVVQAFGALGGDAADAVREARGFKTVEGWTAWQMTHTATVGAAALAIPFAHLPAMAADVAFLMHKMARCCWGIGGILNSPVDPLPDFAVILGLWSGAIKEDSLNAAAGTAFAGAGVGLIMHPTFAGKVAAHGLGLATSDLAAKVGSKPALKAGVLAAGNLGAPLAGKIVEKISAKLAAKISAKTVSATIGGFVPFLGPAAGAGINIWFMHRITDAADLYYKAKRRHENA